MLASCRRRRRRWQPPPALLHEERRDGGLREAPRAPRRGARDVVHAPARRARVGRRARAWVERPPRTAAREKADERGRRGAGDDAARPRARRASSCTRCSSACPWRRSRTRELRGLARARRTWRRCSTRPSPRTASTRAARARRAARLGGVHDAGRAAGRRDASTGFAAARRAWCARWSSSSRSVAAHPRRASTPAPSRGYVRGSLDLAFEHEGAPTSSTGRPTRSRRTRPTRSARHVAAHYAEQAQALRPRRRASSSASRSRADHEARFGGLLYCFLRGLGEARQGVWSARPVWDEVRRVGRGAARARRLAGRMRRERARSGGYGAARFLARARRRRRADRDAVVARRRPGGLRAGLPRLGDRALRAPARAPGATARASRRWRRRASPRCARGARGVPLRTARSAAALAAVGRAGRARRWRGRCSSGRARRPGRSGGASSAARATASRSIARRGLALHRADARARGALLRARPRACRRAGATRARPTRSRRAVAAVADGPPPLTDEQKRAVREALGVAARARHRRARHGQDDDRRGAAPRAGVDGAPDGADRHRRAHGQGRAAARGRHRGRARARGARHGRRGAAAPSRRRRRRCTDCSAGRRRAGASRGTRTIRCRTGWSSSTRRR